MGSYSNAYSNAYDNLVNNTKMANEVLSRELYIFINKVAKNLDDYDQSTNPDGYQESDNIIIACATDFTFDLTKDSIPIQCMNGTGWKRSLADDKGWSISSNALVIRVPATGETSWDEILQDFKTTDEPIIIAIGSTVSADSYEIGFATITGLSENGATGAPATWSLSAEGYDKLETKTVT